MSGEQSTVYIRSLVDLFRLFNDDTPVDRIYKAFCKARNIDCTTDTQEDIDKRTEEKAEARRIVENASTEAAKWKSQADEASAKVAKVVVDTLGFMKAAVSKEVKDTIIKLHGTAESNKNLVAQATSQIEIAVKKIMDVKTLDQANTIKNEAVEALKQVKSATLMITEIIGQLAEQEHIIRIEQERRNYEKLLKIREKNKKLSGCIAAGADRTVATKTDGTVISVGIDDSSDIDRGYDVSAWRGIESVCTGLVITHGLVVNGNVLSTPMYRVRSYNNEMREYHGYRGEGNVTHWFDIVAIYSNTAHVIGLKTNGSLVAVGDNEYGQCNVTSWSDISEIAVSSLHTVGLKKNGMVVAVGDNKHGQCNVGDWSKIVSVSAGHSYTIGLKEDGHVIAVGDISNQYDIFNWERIVAISAGSVHTVGLKIDGTVIATGNNDLGQCNVVGWREIVAIATGWSHTVGLKKDGTVVAVGNNSKGQCNVSTWQGIGKISDEAKENYLLVLCAQAGICYYCGGKLGFFSRKCKNCGR